jgi:lipid-binding SYLF domain-containing protein
MYFARPAILALLILVMPSLVHAQSKPPGAEEQEIIDRARFAVDAMRRDPDFASLNQALERAKAVLIVPSLLKAGFILGAEGGSGVLLARDPNGNWSYPAFYTLLSASVGLQIGAQDAEVVLAVMTDKGLEQVIKTEFKLGADASIAVGPKGMGLEAATTAAFGADVYSYAKTRGAFGGVSFEGSFVRGREEWNRNYYGQPATTREIVLEHKVANPGADSLRQALGPR